MRYQCGVVAWWKLKLRMLETFVWRLDEEEGTDGKKERRKKSCEVK